MAILAQLAASSRRIFGLAWNCLELAWLSVPSDAFQGDFGRLVETLSAPSHLPDKLISFDFEIEMHGARSTTE